MGLAGSASSRAATRFSARLDRRAVLSVACRPFPRPFPLNRSWPAEIRGIFQLRDLPLTETALSSHSLLESEPHRVRFQVRASERFQVFLACLGRFWVQGGEICRVGNRPNGRWHRRNIPAGLKRSGDGFASDVRMSGGGMQRPAFVGASRLMDRRGEAGGEERPGEAGLLRGHRARRCLSLRRGGSCALPLFDRQRVNDEERLRCLQLGCRCLASPRRFFKCEGHEPRGCAARKTRGPNTALFCRRQRASRSGHLSSFGCSATAELTIDLARQHLTNPG